MSSSGKFKASTLRRHKHSKPYDRPKQGIVAAVKSWLAPSNWFSWGGGEGEERGSTTNRKLEIPPSQDGSVSSRGHEQTVLESASNRKMVETDSSSEEEMEDALESPSPPLGNQQSQLSQTLPSPSAQPRFDAPSTQPHFDAPSTQPRFDMHKVKLFNKNGMVVVSRKEGAGESSSGISGGGLGAGGTSATGRDVGDGGGRESVAAIRSSSPVIVERRWLSTQRSSQSWSTTTTVGSTPFAVHHTTTGLYGRNRSQAPPTGAVSINTTPGFSISAFHTPSPRLTARSISHSPFLSPYYSGKTSFGGIASKQKLKSKRPRMDTSPTTASTAATTTSAQLPIRQTVQARPSQEKRITTTSQMSQRILDTLQALGSPLSDARKLPLRPAKRIKVDGAQGSSSSISSLSPPPSLPPPPVNPLLTFNTSVSSPRPSGLTQHLTAVPTTHSSPLNSSMSTFSSGHTSTNSYTTSPLSTSISFAAKDRSGGGGGGKIKRDKQSLHFTSSQSNQHQLNTSPLPPPISLSFSSSSPLSFSLSASSTTQQSALKVISINPTLTTTTVTHSLSSSFGFAKPMVMSSPKAQITSVDQGSPFQFSVPRNLESHDQSVAARSTSTTPSISASPTIQSNPKQTTSSSPLAAPPPPLKSMSVLEALKRPEYKVENIRKDAAKESTDTIDLTSDNEEEDEQLEEKETEEVAAPPVGSSAPTGGMKPLSLAPPSSSWTCDDCWVSNKDTASSCVACGGARPGSNKPSISSSLAPPSSSWTCDDCWVSNKDTASSCVACGGTRPGSNKPGSSSTSGGKLGVSALGNTPLLGNVSSSSGLSLGSLNSGSGGGFKLPSSGLLFGNSPLSSASTSVSNTTTTSLVTGELQLSASSGSSTMVSAASSSSPFTGGATLGSGFKLSSSTGGFALASGGLKLHSSTATSSSSSTTISSASSGLVFGDGGLKLPSSMATSSSSSTTSSASSGLVFGGGGLKLPSSSAVSSSGTLGGGLQLPGSSATATSTPGGISLGGSGVKLITSSSPLLTSLKSTPSSSSSQLILPSLSQVNSTGNPVPTTQESTSLSTQPALSTPSLFGGAGQLSSSSARPTPSTASQATSQQLSLAQFAPPVGSWSCDTCLVSNKPDAEQCVACCAPKPGAKLPALASANQLGSGTTQLGDSGGLKLTANGGLSLAGGVKLSANGGGLSLAGGAKLSVSAPGGGIQALSTGSGLQLGVGLFAASSSTTAGPLQLGSTTSNGLLFDTLQTEQPKLVASSNASSFLPSTSTVAGFKFSSSLLPSSSAAPSFSGAGVQLGQSTVTSTAPFSFTGSLMTSSSAATSVLSNLSFSSGSLGTSAKQPVSSALPAIQPLAATPSFNFSGAKQTPVLPSSSSGGSLLFGSQQSSSSVMPVASSAPVLGGGFFGSKTPSSTGTGSIFQSPALTSISTTTAATFNFSGASGSSSSATPFKFGPTPAGNGGPVLANPAPQFKFGQQQHETPAPVGGAGSALTNLAPQFKFGQQQHQETPPTLSGNTAPSTIFSSTPKINFGSSVELPSGGGGGGGGIFSQIASGQTQGTFQFSASTSSLSQQPLGLGVGLANSQTSNSFPPALPFGGSGESKGSMFSAGISSGVGPKRTIKKAARRKK